MNTVQTSTKKYIQKFVTLFQGRSPRARGGGAERLHGVPERARGVAEALLRGPAVPAGWGQVATGVSTTR